MIPENKKKLPAMSSREWNKKEKKITP